MGHFIPVDDISKVLNGCIQEGLMNEDNPLVVFYDFDFFVNKIKDLKKSFPCNTIHTTAIKANPLVKVLQKAKEKGMGAEAASEGELFLAQKSGFSGKKIIFDSPAKTIKELRLALENHMYINADSVMELERISDFIKDIKDFKGQIGLRINPQAGYGHIKSTSLAGEYSKFGVPIKSQSNEILNCFIKYDWLKGIHMHIGSQGCEPALLLKGIDIGLKLITDINKKLKPKNRKVAFFDIGGGLPVSYKHSTPPPSIVEYGKAIQEALNIYQLENLQLFTEFGRYLHANSGFIVSKVEYAKHYGESNTLIIHAGADILLRECLNPEHWFHEISLFDCNGKAKKEGEMVNYHIAGPLCFANDIVARNVILPKVEEGDILVIHDTGGYTFGMWSKYVSRLFPRIIGIENGQYSIIKEKEKAEDIFKFWNE